MDQTVTPANGSWTATVDSVPVTITAQSWDDATTLNLTTDDVVPPHNAATIQLNTLDQNLRNTNGLLVAPFGPEAF